MTPAGQPTGFHCVTPAELEALARGGGGADLVRRLALARRSKVLLALRVLLALGAPADAAPGLTGAAAERTVKAYRLLARLQRERRDVVAWSLRYPAVSAWLIRTAATLTRGDLDGVRPDLLAHVAATAAHRAGARYEIELPPAEDGRVVLPGLGVATPPRDGPDRPLRMASVGDGSSVLRSAGGEAFVPADATGATPAWQPLSRIKRTAGDVGLALLIDCTGFGGHLGGLPPSPAPAKRTVRTWSSVVGNAWALLAAAHRPVMAEASATFAVLTPIGHGVSGASSATAVDAHGALMMSPPETALGVAEIFAHEVQHAKLALLMDLYPMLESELGECLYVPWRRDPRPPNGLLHGAYAHLGVARFWGRRLGLGTSGQRFHAQVQFARWRSAAAEVTDLLLRLGVLTPVGRQFVTGMRETLVPWLHELVSAAAVREAEDQAREHRRRWAGGRPLT